VLLLKSGRTGKIFMITKKTRRDLKEGTKVAKELNTK